MQSDTIKAIEIDSEGKLHIIASNVSFPMVYRTSTEVHWDSKKHSLHSPKPSEWSYIEWFNHIIAVAENECNQKLVLTDATKWVNVPDELKDKLCGK